MLVHTGDTTRITRRHLLFTDDLLFNLLYNLVANVRRFSSKEKVIEFAKMVEAERLLGITPKVRPRNLRFFSRSYTKQDLAEL